VLTAELGRHKTDITQFVSASNDALSAIAAQNPDVRRATAELPGTLKSATTTFHQLDAVARQLGPAFNSLRPFARNLDAMNTSVRDLANSATPTIKSRIRPFVRAARPDIPPLNVAAQRYSKAAPKLTVLGHEINRLANMAAFNPHGAEAPGTSGRDEGFLYWAAWLGHNADTVFANQDANGLYRRIYFTASCSNVMNILLETPLAAVATPLGVVFNGKCT
jgi:phospholipid/cholesterol/gamma-HCH transport system substrate-binding protein